MAKQLHCGDLMPGCDVVITGKNEDEVMMKAAEHAKSDHHIATVPPQLAGKIKQAITDEDVVGV